MRKLVFLASFILATSFLSGCGGTTPEGSNSGTVDSRAKQAFLSCKQKVDVVKTSISELTMEESHEYEEPSRVKRSEKYYNELPKERYLTLQNFGLYVLNNVYHCVTFGYDSENTALTTMIYDEVNNELDGKLREALKNLGIYTNFYMQIEQEDNGYSFAVDWLGKEGYRGNIYVGGKVEMSGNDVAKFTVTSYTQDDSTYVFASHYDFVDNDFYMLNFSMDRSSGVNLVDETFGIIDKLNNAQLELADLEEMDYDTISVCSGKITKNVSDINYRGYARNPYPDISSNKDSLLAGFNSVKDKFTAAKVRNSRMALDYSKSTRVHFMDKSLQYGLDTTKLYVTDYGSAIFPFVNVSDFVKMCDNVPSAFSGLFANAKAKLLGAKADKSIEFEDGDLRIFVNCKNERYYSLNTYMVDSICYSITDKTVDETTLFDIKGDRISNIRSTNLDYIPLDDPNYEETIVIGHSFGHTYERQLNTIVQQFNTIHSGKYKIQLRKFSAEFNEIANQIRAGAEYTLPELVLGNSVNLTELIKDENLLKYLYNVDSLIEDKNVGLTTEQKGMFDQAMFNDTNNYSVEGRWLVPYCADDYYLVYNPKYFEGADKQFDLPTTFEELIDVCRAIKDKGINCFAPLYVKCDSDFILNLMFQREMPLFSSDAKNVELIRNENKGQLMELVGELADYVNSGLMETNSCSGRSLFGLDDSSYVMAIAKADLASYSQIDAKMAPMPYANSNQQYIRTQGISGFTMFKTGKPYATKGAWLFAKELLSEFAVQEPLSRLTIPAVEYSTEPSGNTCIDYMISAANKVKSFYAPMPKVNSISKILGEFDSVLRNIESGISVSETVQRLINNIAVGL